MEITEHFLLLLSVVLLLLFSAFFSGSETALFSLSRSSVLAMKKTGGRGRKVHELLAKPRMLLVTLLFGNLLVNIASTSVVTALAIDLFGGRGAGYAMLSMTFLILIFGEITPKSVAIRHARFLAPVMAPFLGVLMIILTPVRVLLGAIADFTVEKSRRFLGESRETYASSELATAVESGHIDGVFDEFERRILMNLFSFTETAVYEIQTPRVDVFTLDADTGIQDAIARVKNHGYTRVPLIERSSWKVVGILHARDLLKYPKGEKMSVRDVMRPARFVPETKKIRDLLGELITDKQHVAVTVDEYGSFEGIVTLEDILEEIFGEIRDRREPKVDEYNLIDEDHIVVEGAMRLEDLNERFGTSLDSDEVETIGGYLTEMTGKIPREGEVFNFSGLRCLVLSAGATRINKLKIERQRTPGSEDGDD